MIILLSFIKMQSIDGQILIESIEFPYYRGTFTDVPMDPFGIALFGYLGKINQELYDENLRKFKQTITPEDIKILKKGSLNMDSFLELIQEEYSNDLDIYYFLYNFFGLQLKLYGEIYRENFSIISVNTKANKEVYLFLKDDKYFPVLYQEIDGTIRLMTDHYQ